MNIFQRIICYAKFYIKNLYNHIVYPENEFIYRLANACRVYEIKKLDPNDKLSKIDYETMDLLRSFKIWRIRKYPFIKKVTIYLERPGIFIGFHGELLNLVKEHTRYEIKLVELKKSPNHFEEMIDGISLVYSFEDGTL